jgi:hypothetical protein
MKLICIVFNYLVSAPRKHIFTSFLAVVEAYLRRSTFLGFDASSLDVLCMKCRECVVFFMDISTLEEMTTTLSRNVGQQPPSDLAHLGKAETQFKFVLEAMLVT